MFDKTLAVALPTSLLFHLKAGTTNCQVNKERAIKLLQTLAGHDVRGFYASEPADVLTIDHEIEDGTVIQICLSGAVTTLRLIRE